MSARYETSAQADQDIFEIGLYLANRSVTAAERLIDRLKATFDLLAQSPGIGRSREELAPDLRGFPVGNYVVFYRPTDFGIEVIRVLHGARDIESLFRDSEQ